MPYEAVETGLSGGEVRQAILDRYREDIRRSGGEKSSVQDYEDYLYDLADKDLDGFCRTFKTEEIKVRSQ